MKILFTLAVFSFLALVWAAFAITRHIRKSSATAFPPQEQDPELAEAIERRLSGLVRQSATEAPSGDASTPDASGETTGIPSYSLHNPDTLYPVPRSDSSGPIRPATADRS